MAEKRTFLNWVDTDEIAVGFIYRTETVRLKGAAAILDSSVDPTFIDTKNRPVLAQTFEEIQTSALVTIAVNHFKSKGSSCDSLGDPNTGDGQGNCNLTRTKASQALVNWLATDPTQSGDSDFLIIGDLNAYAKEDPVSVMKSAGYTDLINHFSPDNSGYSYTFYGQAGYLDHALASSNLLDQVTGVTEWHINTDEPRVLDYNTEYKSPSQIINLYNEDVYRASDHDPIIVGLNLTPPELASVHVKDIDSYARWTNKANQKQRLRIVVRVVDNQNNPVKDAIISGKWSGNGVDRNASCKTYRSGRCKMDLIVTGNAIPRLLSVTDVNHDIWLLRDICG